MRRALDLFLGKEAYVRWKASPFNDAAEFGEGGEDGGVFTLHAFDGTVLTLTSGPSFKDIRIEDILEISDADARDLIACIVCVEFDTGPLMERATPVAIVGIDITEMPSRWARRLLLADGWVLHWFPGASEDEYLPFCPYHARGLKVPRADRSMSVGDAQIDLKEFDYIGHIRDTATFKHIATRRYLNIRVIDGVATAGELSEGGWVKYTVADGLARARSSGRDRAVIKIGMRVKTALGLGTILRAKFDPQFWVVKLDDKSEAIFSERDIEVDLNAPLPESPRYEEE
jgi:hypothetical protein